MRSEVAWLLVAGCSKPCAQASACHYLRELSVESREGLAMDLGDGAATGDPVLTTVVSSERGIVGTLHQSLELAADGEHYLRPGVLEPGDDSVWCSDSGGSHGSFEVELRLMVPGEAESNGTYEPIEIHLEVGEDGGWRQVELWDGWRIELEAWTSRVQA